jgi:hypothetical protein
MNTREQHDVTTGPQPTGETKETHTDRVKNAISEAERIRTLRDRLYARGDTLSGLQRHAIPPQVASAPHKTEDVVPTIQHHEDVAKDSSPETAHLLQNTVSLSDMPIKRKRSYRKIVALVGVVFFCGCNCGCKPYYVFWNKYYFRRKYIGGGTRTGCEWRGR